MTAMRASSREGFYFIKGTMNPGDPSYVERRADRELLEGLLRGEFCYVLTSRQMGKSSLLVRTAQRLRSEGVAAEVLDLTAIGSNVTPEQWYAGMIFQLAMRLRLESELLLFWREQQLLGPLRRWVEAIRRVILPNLPGRLVILVDEIDSVRSLPFPADEFFAGIRECYNLRSEDAELNRLTFGLFGVTTPAELIQDPRTTPFNIGRRIELADFAESEARNLIHGLGRAPELGERLLRRVLYWSGGQPFLTQRLCQVIAQDERLESPADVDRACGELFFTPKALDRDENLRFVQGWILREAELLPSLLDVYGKVRRGARVAVDQSSQVVAILQLAGLAREVAGRLRVRNRIYARVFDKAWIRANMPDAEIRRQRAAARRAAIRIAALSAGIVIIVSTLAAMAFREAESRRQALYLRQMGVAWQEWKEHSNTERIGDLLAQTIPRWWQPDLRSFEWDLLWNLTQTHRQKLSVSHEILSVSFSADGRAIIYVELDDARPDGQTTYLVRTYDGQAGAGTESFTAPAGVNFNPILFTADGRRVVMEDASRDLTLWDVERRSQLGVLKGTGAALSALRFSPDGRWLAMGDLNGNVKVVDPETGQVLVQMKNGTARIHSLSFLPDGRGLCCADGTLILRCLNVRTGAPLREMRLGESGVMGVAAVSDDTLVTTTIDGALQFRDSRSGQARSALSGGGQALLSFSPNGKMGASVGLDRAVHVFSVPEQRELTVIKGHGARINHLAWAPDSRQLATVSSDGILKVWDLPSLIGSPSLRTITEQLFAGGFNDRGEPLVFGVTREGAGMIWNLATNAPPVRLIDPSEPARAAGEKRPRILYAVFSPDAKRVFTGGTDSLIKCWEVATGRLLQTLSGHAGFVYNLDVSPDGRWLISGGADRRFLLWDLQIETGPRPHELISEEAHSYRARFSPDGARIATATRDGGVLLWETATRRLLRPFREHSRIVRAIAFSPDGRFLATGGEDERLLLWSLETGRRVRLFGRISEPYRLAFSADGKRLISGSESGAVNLWDTMSGEEIFEVQGHRKQITSIQFAADRKSLLITSEDGRASYFRSAAQPQ